MTRKKTIRKHKLSESDAEDVGEALYGVRIKKKVLVRKRGAEVGNRHKCPDCDFVAASQ